MVRTDSHQLRTVAGDSDQAEAIKVVTRAHKTLIWERTWHTLWLRHALREFFPAAPAAVPDLTGADALEGAVALARRTQAPPSIAPDQMASVSSANAVASRCRGATSVASS